ncbi:MAG: helix-turn-helix transcriptional regulator [Bacteroidota bacterium]
MEKHPVYEIKKFNCKPNENDLYINDFKSHLMNHDFIEKPHSHNFYLMVFFTQGTGLHTIDFDQFEIQSGSFFIMKPGQVHSWQLSQDIDGYIVFYSQEVYNLYFGNKKIEEYSFYRNSKNSPEILLDELQIVELKKYFNLLIDESKKNEFKKLDKLLNLIDSILIEMARIYDSLNTHTVHPYNLKINRLENLLTKHFKEEKAPSFYADKMNMSLKHLNRICKDVLNITLTDFIYTKIILESKRLISVEGKAISEVANELGFVNYSYYTKVFKKYTGMTPQHFKKQSHF